MSLSLEQIDTMTESLVKNASELISESETLCRVAAYARAFALAHLAREEIAKCGILHAAGTRMLAGIQVDWKKTMRRLRDHKAKLELETVQQLMLMSGEQSQVPSFQLSAVSSAVEYRNDRKNAALYVGFEEGRSLLPSEAFSEHQARRTIELAKFSLHEQVKISQLLGAFKSRPALTIPGLAELEKLTASQQEAFIKEFGPVYSEIVKKLLSEQPALNT